MEATAQAATQAAETLTFPFPCPDCDATVQTGTAGCDNCGWKGVGYVFGPVPEEIEAPRPVQADDTPCVFHPHFAATTNCEATGDYICPLCVIQVGSKPYSAAYAERAGIDTLGDRYRTTLPRPDRLAVTFTLIAMVPYAAFFVLPLAWYFLIKARKLRKSDRYYADIVTSNRVDVIMFFVILFSLPVLLMGVALVVGIVLALVELLASA